MFLVMAIGNIGMPAFASSAPAVLTGKVLRTGTGAPVQGAVVKLNNRADKKTYASPLADRAGSYSISDLPAGTYDLAIETAGGVFVVSSPVSLAAGETREASFSLQPKSGAADEPGAGGSGGATPPAETKTTEKKKTPWYVSPWFGAAVVIGSAVIVGAIINSSDDNEPASASPSSN